VRKKNLRILKRSGTCTDASNTTTLDMVVILCKITVMV
jgi:hypothetical protein